ncbi:hypothetical protein SNEBB_000247 [Seison nebaliae]|nr:hypothetical protein SNEBB_000247 [Seison nebaliae]
MVMEGEECDGWNGKYTVRLRNKFFWVAVENKEEKQRTKFKGKTEATSTGEEKDKCRTIILEKSKRFN